MQQLVRLNRYLLTVVLLGICTTSGIAGTWRLWGTYKGDRIYYQNLVRDRDSVKVWIKRRAVMGRINFDCSSSSLTMLAAVENGQPYDEWDQFYAVKPSTLGAWLFKKACK